MFFTFGSTLLSYTVAAFALSQRADSHSTTLSGFNPSAPEGFKITSITFNGSGCPPASAYYSLNLDRNSISVTFSKYFVRIGPGVPIGSSRNNCRLTIGTYVPPGFTYFIENVAHRGYYQLDANVTATQQTTHYFSGLVRQATTGSTIVGPIVDMEHTYRDSFDIGSIEAPCGVASVLNIQSNLSISNSKNISGGGYIGSPNDDDPIDCELSITFNLWWLKC